MLKNLASGRQFRLLNLVFIVIVFLLSILEAKPPSYYQAQGLNGRQLRLSGQVCSEPESGSKAQSFVFCSGVGKIMMSAALYPSYQYGDYLQGYLTLKIPEPFKGFNYPRYLAKDNIYLSAFAANLDLLGHEDTWRRRLYYFKHRLLELNNRNLPAPEAGLAAALVLGYKKTLDLQLEEEFSVTGLSHLVAISGSHITILSALLLDVFLFLNFSRKRSAWLVAIFLIIYVVATGWQASAVRALVMGLLLLLAYNSGRPARAINALLFSASLMLILNSRLLAYDIGFQLSFMAMLGMIYLKPRLDALLDKFLEQKREAFSSVTRKVISSLGRMLNLTIACQLTTAPLLIYYFNQLSLIAPLSNILVLWTFPLLMTALIAALALASLWPFFSLVFFYPAYLLLKFITSVVSILAQTPGANISF